MSKLQEKAAKSEMRSAMNLDQLAELEKKKEVERWQKELEAKWKIEEFDAEKAWIAKFT